MKYLSKEELEDITNELLENHKRETLKVLNNKYNSEENGVETKKGQYLKSLAEMLICGK